MSSSKDQPITHAFTTQPSDPTVRDVDFATLPKPGQSSPPPAIPLGQDQGLSEASSSFVVTEEQEHKQKGLQKRLEGARQEGYAEAEAHYQSQLEAAQQSLEAYQLQTLERLRALEEAALARVLWVGEVLGRKYAEHLLSMTLEHEDAMVAAVRLPLLRACGLGQIRLAVHPDAIPPLQQRLDELTDGQRDASTIEVLPDPALALGDCRITSEEGQIESLLDERLERLVELTSSRLEAYSSSQPPLVPEQD